MQKHGLIVADNGSDMYVSGTFDTRWNNSLLNPAFRLLTAGDFEVVQLGWNPVGIAPALDSVSVQPASVVGGAGATGSVSLTAAAPGGGALVSLASNQGAALLPSSVTVAQGATSASFGITTTAVGTATTATITASWSGISKSATLTVNPPAAPALSSMSLTPTRVIGGQPAKGTVVLSSAAPAGGATVSLRSSSSAVQLPASVLVPAGASQASFAIGTSAVRRNISATISASHGTRTVSNVLTITRR
jgi:hypothetical protein